MRRFIWLLIQLMLFLLAYLFLEGITFDWHAQTAAQTQLNILKNQPNKLKRICDKQTYNQIRKARQIKLSFTTDNQGGPGIAYYPAKINHSKYYGITLKINSEIPTKFTLVRVKYFGKH